MKLLILSILLIPNIVKAELHFKDCVVVTKGFYAGCKGTLEEQYGDNAYEIRLINCKDTPAFNTILSSKDFGVCKK